MRKTLILLLVSLSLFGCFETSKKAVRGELQEPQIEKLIANIPGITPNTVIAYPYKIDNQTLSIDFLAYKVENEPVFGLAINLSYDSEVLKYFSYKKGDFLEQGGKSAGNQNPVYFINVISKKSNEEPSIEEKLIIGSTLFRGTPGVVGSGRLLTIHFKMKKNASTEIMLTKSKLKNLKAKDISDINWPHSIPVYFQEKRAG